MHSLITRISSAGAAIRRFAVAHKAMSAVIAIIILGGGWFMYTRASSTSGQTRYVLGTVSSSTVIATVSASGQVSASTELDLKPKVSGDVTAVDVQPGDTVTAGQLIVALDAKDAEKAVRDAQANLESAQLSLEKTQEPADALTLTQAQNTLQNTQSALVKDYSGGGSDVINTFVDLPTIMAGLQDVNFGTETNHQSQWNMDFYENAAQVYDPRAQSFHDAAKSSYDTAKTSYDALFDEYKAADLSSADQTTVDKLLSDTDATLGLVENAVKDSNALVQFYSDTLTAVGSTPSSVASTQLTSLTSYTSKLSTHASALLNDQNGIKSDQASITAAQESLQKTQAGADPIDLQSAQLNVTKAQNALNDAESNLAEYYVRAPFGGTVAAVNVKKYDSAGSGSAVATIITSQQIAELSVNEVDAAKIKAGDKATLTFDAIDGLTLTGTVAQIDPVGTVSQGVVSYNVQIAFDSQDSRIKAGMTVNADIISDAHPDVLVVPSSAVKIAQDGSSYVLAFTPPLSDTGGSAGVTTSQTPQQIPVVVGISDDTNTEIQSGLMNGQQLVVRTQTGATAARSTTPTATSLLGGGGARAGFGGGGFGGSRGG